ncbi:MAG: hypothetical protein HOV81_43975 [Kofleriaceae bacterium]|nr:hypothetical protein [Kofleriaceae bacterium]
MHRLALAGTAALVLALPSLADARPITAGVGLGRLQAKADADGDASDTVQLYGRIGLTRRISGQLELQKITLDGTSAVGRTGTALLVVDLGSHPHLVPTMFAGFGIDRGDNGFGGDQTGHHIEGGFGLEYRASGGLVISADLRLGGRSVDQSDEVYPLAGVLPLYYPALPMREGEYRSARVGVGIRF